MAGIRAAGLRPESGTATCGNLGKCGGGDLELRTGTELKTDKVFAKERKKLKKFIVRSNI